MDPGQSRLWIKFKESHLLWSAERDEQLAAVRWNVKKLEFCLQRCLPEPQVWMIRDTDPAETKLCGLLIVQVDEFLLQTELGPARDAFLAALGSIWTMKKEEVLTQQHSLSFLGVDIDMRPNGDYFVHQERFANSLLNKYC